MDILGPSAHVFQFKTADPLADRRLDLALSFNGIPPKWKPLAPAQDIYHNAKRRELPSILPRRTSLRNNFYEICLAIHRDLTNIIVAAEPEWSKWVSRRTTR